MRNNTLRDPRNPFALIVDTACLQPWLIERQGLGVMVVVLANEYVQLGLATAVADNASSCSRSSVKR